MIPSHFSTDENICESQVTILYVDGHAATELLPGFGKGFFLYLIHLKIKQLISIWKVQTFSQVSRFHITFLQTMKM